MCGAHQHRPALMRCVRQRQHHRATLAPPLGVPLTRLHGALVHWPSVCPPQLCSHSGLWSVIRHASEVPRDCLLEILSDGKQPGLSSASLGSWSLHPQWVAVTGGGEVPPVVGVGASGAGPAAHGDGDCPQPWLSAPCDLGHSSPTGRHGCDGVNLQSPLARWCWPRWGRGPQEACGRQALRQSCEKSLPRIHHRPTSWPGSRWGLCLETRGVNYRTELTSFSPSPRSALYAVPCSQDAWRQA